MFIHSFKTRLKIIFNNKGELFWILLFPLVLVTFFYIAFGHMKETTFEKIDIAICGVTENDQLYKTLSETNMFTLSAMDYDTAINKLKDGKIQGVIDTSENFKLFVSGNGINQSITKFILDSYIQTTQAVTDIVSNNPELLKTDFIENISERKSYSEVAPLSDEGNYDFVSIMFCTVFGMAAMMGSCYMISVVNSLQANQNPLAVRVCSSPVKKTVVFTANMLAVFLTTFSSIVLCMLYIKFILQVNIGNHTLHTLLLLLIGTLASISLGSFICIALKCSDNLKNGIIVGISLIGSAMSGMMSNGIKYYLDTYAPFVQKLNIVNLMTDGMYSLYFYGVNTRYYTNIAILGLFALVFSILTFIIARRQKYASV